MKLHISEVKETMLEILHGLNYEHKDAEFIVEVYLGGELRGHKTHGLAPFPGFVRHDFSKCEKPKVLLDTHALYFVEANKNSGIVLGKYASDIIMEKARTEGTATAIIRNMFDWVRPGAIAEYIAKNNFVAIVTNDGSGRSIAPPGGFDPTVGTNPIAYGLPTNTEPLVVEMASAKRAWGNVRVANKYGIDLPEKTFLTDKGDFARDPKDAHSVLPFGEHKGFSLALLVEIMNGSMIGHSMMPDSDASSYANQWPANSGIITVYNPALLTSIDEYKNETTNALNYIRNTNHFEGQEIRIPGEHATKIRKASETNGFIEVPEEVWDEIKSL
ncbi:MAG: Ldh family oxidoreductase [Acidimicrobiia bacterium]